MDQEELWNGIRTMSADLGFADCGCAQIVPLSGSAEEGRYLEAEQMGHFGKMDYLKRNVDKRMDPTLLLPGAKSVIVFLAPFGGKSIATEDGLKYSSYALGNDYHKVIKDKLYLIASFIGENCGQRKMSRVFTDSAPVMERAWAVRSGLGFIGKNNFLISPKAGIKNFIGIIITTAELPYPDKTVENRCGQCTRCLDACSRKALYAPFRVDASKCLSYKTIEEPLDEADKERTDNLDSKWIFGCDDCADACPWNRFNKPGWPEFSSNKKFLESCNRDFWSRITEDEFLQNFKDSPLLRAGLAKIRKNISR
ncbi:MAG: tRNA epoxyqueuosine(34) reductase QueG [Bacteroidales bacterium]|nr:tRNA epoxyqueuosine(34) reductase QueG [Bacteroidales bacterium]